LGPWDLRHPPARFVDSYLNPRQYIKNNYIKYGLYVPDYVDRRATLLPLDDTLQHAYDPYAFVRDAYLERRAYLVSDGKITYETLVDPAGDVPDTSSERNPTEVTPSAAPGEQSPSN